MTIPSGRVPVSVAIISLNEAQNIERCLRSVPFADEIIVVDSGSSDGTPEIATRLGAKVRHEAWRGFRDQKQFAVACCRNDWILSLDADEALSEEAAHELQSLLTRADVLEQHDGFSFPRLTWNLGRWIRHGGWYPDRQLRFFNRQRAHWGGGEHVHERVELNRPETLVELKTSIQHWPFASLADQIETNNRYSTLGARELQRRSRRFSVLALTFKPISKFFETYVLKGGFRDGLAGFVIAVGAAYSVFLKFAKLWELERKAKDV